MFNTITAQIALGDTSKIDSLTFTINDYARALEKREPQYTDFVEAFLNYGRFAVCYFGKTTDYPIEYTSADYERVISQITPSSGIKDADYIGSSLLLETNTVLRHYFSENKSGRTAKMAEVNGEYKYVGYYVQKSFAPTDFNSGIDGYNYTINDYIYKVLKSDSTNIGLKNLCVALYDYSEASKILK